MTPRPGVVPPKLVDMCAPGTSESDVLRSDRGENTCSQWANGDYRCVGQVVDVPTAAVVPKLVNVAVNPLIDDMLQITKFIPGRRGERQLRATRDGSGQV